MHGPIRDRLEDLLAAASSAAESPKGVPMRPAVSDIGHEVRKHLSSCRECSAELELMQGQCVSLRSLRIEGEAEPGPGFYARVIQRIEESAKDSIWSVFVYSPFGVRLGFRCVF